MGLLKADVVVIGGGAAGSMCALTAAQRGLHVVLLEPNKMLGKKLRITGKGRCNVTNHCDVKTILANIPGDGRFLYSALNRLGPQDTMALFESLGVPLKTERGNRVFPVSDRSHDVANALERAYAHAGGKVVHAAATDILTQDGAVSAVVTTEGAIDCDAAVICTGGLSYPLTGSTGDGYRFAQRLGHTVTPTRASLVPLESEDPWCAEMQGFSLRNVTLTVYDEQNKAVYSDLGEMLFTHFGVSGPLVLSASAHMRDFSRHKYRLSIDLKPALDEKKLDARILRDFQKYANRDFKNALYDLAGHAMIPVLVRLSGIPEDFAGKMLEVPVGTGILTMPVYQTLPKADVTCLDYSPDMMGQAKEKAEKLHLTNVKFQQGDVGALPFADGEFDLVLSLNGFHAFPDKEAAYRETFRVLKPGGTFCGCFYVSGEHKRTDWMIRHVYEPTKFFTPPYETVDSLRKRLQSMYAQVDVGSLKSIAWFICRKAD